MSPAAWLLKTALALDVAATADYVVATRYAGNGVGVGDVFFDEDALGEGVCVVGLENRNCTLENDGAVVEVFIDEVHSAASDFHSVIEGLLLGVEARESGQQRGVNVEDAVGESGDESGR